jgi:uncharacterized Zn finger protein (UPF0148 family)
MAVTEALRMNCTNCGKPLKEGTAVCSACGKEVVLTSSKNAERTIKHSYSRRKNKVKKTSHGALFVCRENVSLKRHCFFDAKI